MRLYKKHTYFFFISFVVVTLATGVLSLHAATLSVTPASASINQGSTFSMTVRTNTEGRAVNVAEATIIFPSDKLEVVSATGGSTFPLQTPGSPTKNAGSIFFSGGVPSPGYSGTNGVVGRITFRAKASGTAKIEVASGKVLLNDGNATDAFSGVSNATITIKSMTTTPEATLPEPPIVPVEESVVVPVVDTPSLIAIEPTVPTPVDIGPTTVIRTEDLIRLIYVLVGMILLLLVVIIILIAIIIRHRPRAIIPIRKPSTPRNKPSPLVEAESIATIPTVMLKPLRKVRKSRSVESI